MTSRVIRANAALMLAGILVASISPSLSAQIINFTPAGVEIDAQGVLRTTMYRDPSGQLTRQRYQAAQAALGADVQKTSALRKISLNRLEKAIAQRLADHQPLDDVMRSLAGLTQITNVFYYPETKDIVIAGPAEGFYADLSGRVVGMQTGRAVMQLEDLIVALRAFPPSGESARVIGCSIDPTQEGLKQFSETYRGLLKQLGGRVSGNEPIIVKSLREALGMQTVTVKGVSDRTHFAQVLVEADYRMKLIGIGLEEPPVRIPSFIELANPSKAGSNGLVRWYFTPDYQRVRVNEDETAMQLVGQGIKLVGADEIVRPDGARVQKKGRNRASENFCRNFTDRYSELAERSPVFAELRNLMDMSIVAAFIQEMDYYGQAGWQMPVFLQESSLSVESYPAPAQVEPAINAVWKKGMFMTPIGGGVNIQPRYALTVDHMTTDSDGQIDRVRQSIQLDSLAPGQWWWD